jgi:LysR family transcriptional regulator, benzoate and cis,cis-muconate-responsive activator of ben and cat genes
MDVSLRLLRAFLVVAEECNIGRAARRLYISQPALSQDVRRLEREVGVDLFVRGNQGVTLTSAGRAFAEATRQATETIDRAVALARDTAARVSLAYTPSLGNRLLPALLPALERRCPGIRIDEREVDTGEAGPAVEAGRVDLALAHCPDPSPGLVSSPLVDEPLVAALSSSFAAPVSLADLTGLDLLIWPRSTAPCYYDRILEVCHAAGLHPEIRTGPRRALTRSYLLAQGAFALLPEGAATVRIPEVAFVPITEPGASVQLALLSRRDNPRREVAEVMKIIVEEVHHG